MKKVITRFAPSPTGFLHIGSLRTALFSYLWARKNNGLFRLRIEDTDQQREVPGAVAALITTLGKLGLRHDEELVIQSERARDSFYLKHAELLLERGRAYYCFCSPGRLERLRSEQQRASRAPKYDGQCRRMAESKRRGLRARGSPSVVRLAVPAGPIAARDALHGSLTFDGKSLGDPVLLKSDGMPTYHLANVVDDHAMEVTHVIRGDEWIPSLPYHILLYQALEFPMPLFYHVPLILNADRTKLSKRQGHVSVEWYLKQGYLAGALLNYVAFLGWNPGDEREIFSLEELAKYFDVNKLNTSAAVFDIKKLNWYNAWYIKNILAPKAKKDLQNSVAPYLPRHAREKAVDIFNLFYERIVCLAELESMSSFLYSLPRYASELLIFKKSTRDRTIEGLQVARSALAVHTEEWSRINLEITLQRAMDERSLQPGDIYWPVRVAVSGLNASPPPAHIMEFLGRSESLSRIDRALVLLIQG